MIVIFGAGIRGKKYLKSLLSVDIKVDYFCDNNEKLWGQKIHDIPVVSPVDLKEKYIDAQVLIANKNNADEIRAQLFDMGIKSVCEMADIIFKQKRMSYLGEMNISDLCDNAKVPILSIVVIGCEKKEKIAMNTYGSIIAQKIKIPYEVVPWNGRDTVIKGQKVLFLTNRSMIQHGSVEALMQLAEKEVCTVGSKTILADGTINQAGYVFTDENRIESYGWGKRGFEPEFEYVRECDAISLNGLLTEVSDSKRILECIEGETNLKEAAIAFALWNLEQKRKLLFQPFSLIIEEEEEHEEYQIKSNSLCIKYYNNMKTCNVKLEEQFWKANKSSANCYMIMADMGIARFDTNAGNRTTYEYIQILLELNVWILYLVNDFLYDYKYMRLFQEKGIFVVYGEKWRENYRTLLAKLLPRINYAFLNRPDVAWTYIDLIRENSNALIVHFGSDLHCLRLQREYEVTGDKKLLSEISRYKQIEYGLVEKVDITGYPSAIEVEMLKKVFPDRDIQFFPISFFEYTPYERKEKEREGILFVGGYSHRPNEDAALWLVKEILPELRSRGIEDKVYLVGANPTEKILELESEDVIITGYVSDEKLKEFYDSCFMCIFPLRFGAGMKGKVLEALYEGIPIVTTSIGAEGIIGAEQFLVVANSVEEIVDKSETVYKNRHDLQNKGKESHEYILQYYSKTKMKELFAIQIEKSVNKGRK